MIPGTALGVVLGDLAYTWMAFRLARRTGRADVTAMPLGLDTPSTFAVGPLVLLPALHDGMARYGLDHGQAMVFGWHVGAVVLVMVGVFKSVLAPLGGKIRQWVPRAGLLGSLAGIALALIAFLPLWTHIAAVPIVGIALADGDPRGPGGPPRAAGQDSRGLGGRGPRRAGLLRRQLCLADGWGGPWFRRPRITRPPPGGRRTCCRPSPGTCSGGSAWVCRPWPSLPVMLPFALATIVGGIDCTESAAAAGDEYDTRTILLDRRAGLGGGRGVRRRDPKHPVHRPAGLQGHGRPGRLHAGHGDLHRRGRPARLVHALLRVAARGGRLSDPGLRRPGDRRPVVSGDAPAAFSRPGAGHSAGAGLPGPDCRGPGAGRAVRPPPQWPWVVQSLRCLANGFIVTSLLWASALAAMLDGKLLALGRLPGDRGHLQPVRHHPFAASAGGDCPAPARAGPDAARPGHPLPIAVPLGRGLRLGGAAAAPLHLVQKRSSGK